MARILVIRGGAIGDFVLTLPAIKLLRDNFPSAHIEILGYKHIIALAEERFYADKTRSIEYGALSRFFIPNAELDDELVAYFGGFQQVISYLYDPDKFFENNLRRCGVKNLILVSPRIGDSAHAAAQLAQPLESLALYLDGNAATIHPSDADRAFASEFLGDTPRQLLAVHPGSGSERKNWRLENWLALGDRFLSADDTTLLIVGGEADMANLAAMRRAWRDRAVLFAENLPLVQLAALIERCALFLGHDSGISHIAAAVGTPCVLLFGPTDATVWAPQNARVRIISAPTGALDELSVATVTEAAQETLRTPAPH